MILVLKQVLPLAERPDYTDQRVLMTGVLSLLEAWPSFNLLHFHLTAMLLHHNVDRLQKYIYKSLSFTTSVSMYRLYTITLAVF